MNESNAPHAQLYSCAAHRQTGLHSDDFDIDNNVSCYRRLADRCFLSWSCVSNCLTDILCVLFSFTTFLQCFPPTFSFTEVTWAPGHHYVIRTTSWYQMCNLFIFIHKFVASLMWTDRCPKFASKLISVFRCLFICNLCSKELNQHRQAKC